MIWKQPISFELFTARHQKTMVEFLGIEFHEIGDNFLIASMPVTERTLQPHGILHGGASCVLAETVASVAANYCVDEQHYCVGTEINASHLFPAREGRVTAKATPIRIGQTLQVWNIELRDDAGKQTCISRMTAAVLKRRSS